MLHKKDSNPYLALSTLTLVATFSLIMLQAPASYATAEVVQPAVPLSLEQGEPGGSNTFVYELEGRHDPFIPFLTPKATSATPLDPNEIIDEETALTGMQLFEPGQLKLVAVLVAKGEPMALVEDVTGKGYILREGIPIGRRGVVDEIFASEVKITETAKTRAGKEILNTITMKLKGEGDE